MADISFEGDYKSPSPLRQQRNSRITQFFIDKSFGLVQTPAQASVAQLIVAVVFFGIAGFMFSKSGDTVAPSKTPQELINATLQNTNRN